MKRDLLDDLRIASPCNVPWANMIGADRIKAKPIYENGTMRLSGDLIQRLPH